MSLPPSSSSTSTQPPIRVMLVDDSAVIRGLITRVLEEDPQIKVVHSVGNGQLAVDSVAKINPDVLILDIEMPVMDGITALPLLIKQVPGLKVLMCSTLSLRNAEVTLKALQMGATDTIAKPTSAGNIVSSSDEFKSNLINLVKQIGRSQVRRFTGSPQAPATGTAPATADAPARRPSNIVISSDFKLRDIKTAYQGKPAIVAIGSSTGGPQALFDVLKGCTGLDVPIVITQHMPATFTAMLATHINQNTGIPAAEGKEGEVLQPGHIYVAPGGFHMEIVKEANGPTIRLNTNPPENFCRPSVDPMMRSVINVYGNKVLGVILTGMGYDGLASGKLLVEAGGRLFAQDEATSVVWGMPGAVASAGICHSVLPLPEIGPMIKRTVMTR